MLEFFEFIAFSDASGWLKHAGGGRRLIELRGPEAFQNPEDRYLLEGNRVAIALECLIKRKRCFLSSPEWKSVSWEKEPGAKASMMILHDQLCNLPGLVEDAELLRNSQAAGEEWEANYNELASRVMECLRSLYRWRAKLEEGNSNPCIDIPTSSAEPEPLFPALLYFSSLQLANEITVYNAILPLLLRLGTQIIDRTSTPLSQPHASRASLCLSNLHCYFRAHWILAIREL